MTKEKAIERLNHIKVHGADIPSESIDMQRRDIEALDMAIEALKQEPNLGVEYVRRQAVDALVWKYLKKGTDEHIAFYEHFLDLPPVILQELEPKGSYHPIISGNTQNLPKVKSAESEE